MRTATNLKKACMKLASKMGPGSGITRPGLKKSKRDSWMDNKTVYGSSGLAMEQKNQKESFLVASEIVYGPPGSIMETKNFKLLIKMENLMVDGHLGMRVE